MDIGLRWVICLVVLAYWIGFYIGAFANYKNMIKKLYYFMRGEGFKADYSANFVAKFRDILIKKKTRYEQSE